MLGDDWELIVAHDSQPTVKGRGVACVALWVGEDSGAALRLLPEEARALAGDLLLWARYVERVAREL
jgi:hypothetical protein